MIATTGAPALTGRAAELLDELRELEAESEAAYVEMRAAEEAADAAPEQDRQALAVAIRRRADDPGPAVSLAAQHRLDEADRRRTGLTLAREAAEAEFLDAVRTQQTDLVKPLDQAAVKARAAVGKALDALDQALDALAAAQDAARWVTTVASTARAPQAHTGTAVVLDDPVTGKPARTAWASIRAGLAEVADPTLTDRRVEREQRSLRPGVPQMLPVDQLGVGRG